MAVSEVLRALDMLAQQRQRRATAPIEAAQRLGAAMQRIGERNRMYEEREAAEQRQRDFALTRDREQRAHAANMAQNERSRAMIDRRKGNESLFGAAGMDVPEGAGYIDPIAARGLVTENLRRQRESEADAAAAAAEQRERGLFAQSLGLPLMQFAPEPGLFGGGTQLPSPRVLEQMAEEQEKQRQAELAARLADPRYRMQEVLLRVKSGQWDNPDQPPRDALREIAMEGGANGEPPQWKLPLLNEMMEELLKVTKKPDAPEPDINPGVGAVADFLGRDPIPHVSVSEYLRAQGLSGKGGAVNLLVRQANDSYNRWQDFLKPRKPDEMPPNPAWVEQARREFLVSATNANKAAEERGDENLPFPSLMEQMDDADAAYVISVIEGR